MPRRIPKANIILTPKENEAIIASDFIVVSSHELAEDMITNKKPPKSLVHKMILIAPEGIQFLSKEVLEEALKKFKKK